MKTTTVLWDWNGTLMNDVSLCCELLNHQLKRHGYSPVGDINAYRKVFRFPIEQYYQDAGFDFSRHPYAQLAQEYAVLYASQCKSCPLQPEAESVLKGLREMGIHQFILSASEQSALENQVDFYGLTSYFDALLGLNNVYAHSKVDIGLAWMKANHTDPSTVLMVGDSVHDCEVAQALEIRCVLYSGGHQPADVLAATGFPVVNGLDQIFSYL
ncbi:HAD family hydrolase [uncultured Ruthenibacterium sp.]|uniref:HAD family hydrolase n=1 Tax=uncultured Ruthenibacterium sp. TaxID=1905347 RepID=UPI00349E7F69